MKRIHKIIWLTIVLVVAALATNAHADCKIAKSYIITMNGGGYSVAGKLTTDSQTPVGDYVQIPASFVGGMAYTRAESYERPVSVTGISSINFAANCDMNAEISLNGLPLTFTAYSDETGSANGVLIGGVQLRNDKTLGITGGIRISAK